MKITVLKSTVEEALAPILKMVANAKLPADCHPTLTFQSDKQRITIGCTLPEQQLSIVLLDAVFDEKNTAFDVNLDMFRRLLASSKGARLSIETDTAHVMLNCDERFIGQLVPMTSKSDIKFAIPKDADSTVLPTNFANFVLQAFTCAADAKDRLALSGVNVSSKGIAGTDGRQLFYLPLPLQLKNDVTLPQSKNYALLKCLRWTSLAHWKTQTTISEWMFTIAGDCFRYTAKALDTRYPNYLQVIPPDGTCDVKITLSPESAESLLSFLGKKASFATLTIHSDRIELLEDNEQEKSLRPGLFKAKCSGPNLPRKVRINTHYLMQFLKMGFTSLAFPSKSRCPLVSSAGVGTYMFMPCGFSSQSNAAATAPEPEAKPAVTNSPIATPTNTKTKEKTTMTQVITSTPVTTPAPTFTRPVPQTTVPANPLDETLASITAMREQLASLEVRLLEAARKIKAALIEQKQKERQFADATRKLERIRLAV